MKQKKSQEPLQVTFSVGLYGFLLAAYLSEYRSQYGTHMLQVFGDICRRTNRQEGLPGMFSLWVLTMFDYFKTVIEENLQRGTEMSKAMFIKLSGWSMTLDAFAFVFGWIADTRPDYSPYNARSLAIDHYLNDASVILVILGFLLIIIGLVGLYVRFAERSGGFGKFSLVLSIISGLISIAGMIGLFTYDGGPYWTMFFLGMTVMFLGLVFFGIICLRRRVLPRLNILPLAAGIWLPLYVIVSAILESNNGGWVELPQVFYVILISLSGLGLAGLGYVLQSDASEDQQVVVAA